MLRRVCLTDCLLVALSTTGIPCSSTGVGFDRTVAVREGGSARVVVWRAYGVGARHASFTGDVFFCLVLFGWWVSVIAIPCDCGVCDCRRVLLMLVHM